MSVGSVASSSFILPLEPQEKGSYKGFTPRTLLSRAIVLKDLPLVRRAFAEGAYLYEYLLGTLPIHDAARYGSAPIVKELLERKANVNSLDRNGATPLHHACDQNDASVVQVLLDRKADPRVRDEKLDQDPLYRSIQKGNLIVCKLLIEAGAQLNVLRKSDCCTSFRDACLLGNFDIVKLLLDSKADPNFGDSKSSLYATALGYAIDHPAIVKLLLDNNPALVSMPVDNQSWNRHELPVHFAVLEKKPETLKLLIQYGADPMASSLLGLAKPMFTSICKYHKIPREKYVCRVENMDPKIRDLGEIIDLLSNPSRLRQLADKSTDEKTPP